MQTFQNGPKRYADAGVRSLARERRGRSHLAAGVPRHRGPAAWTTGVVLLGMLTACSASAPPDRRAITTSLSAPPPRARGATQRQALATREGMWQAYATAGPTAADPDDPGLARYAAETALTMLQNGFKGYREKDHALKGDLVTKPQVSSASLDAGRTSVTFPDRLLARRWSEHLHDQSVFLL